MCVNTTNVQRKKSLGRLKNDCTRPLQKFFNKALFVWFLISVLIWLYYVVNLILDFWLTYYHCVGPIFNVYEKK